MKIFLIAASFALAVILPSCQGRDEIVDPFDTQSNPVLLYSRQGSIDSIVCTPQASETNIKYLDSINFTGTDSLRIFYKYSVCNPGTSYFELFYLNGITGRTSVFYSELNSSGTLDTIIRSPLIYRSIYTELFTSSSSSTSNCLIIKDLNIYRQ